MTGITNFVFHKEHDCDENKCGGVYYDEMNHFLTFCNGVNRVGLFYKEQADDIIKGSDVLIRMPRKFTINYSKELNFDSQVDVVVDRDYTLRDLVILVFGGLRESQRNVDVALMSMTYLPILNILDTEWKQIHN